MRVPLAILILTMGVMLAPATTGASARPAARSVSGLSVTSISHGLRLTMAFRGSTYPRDSLAWVRYSVTNVAGHSLSLVAACPFGAAWVEDMTAAGRVLYPPAFPRGPQPSCPFIAPSAFPAGKTMAGREIVLLRASTLRLVALVWHQKKGTTGHGYTGHTVDARSRPLHVSFTAAKPEYIALHDARSNLHGTVWPGVRGGAGLYSSSWTACRKAHSAETTASLGFHWHLSKRNAVWPGLSPSHCPDGFQWHVIAGWIGYPVARLDMHRAGRS